VTRALRRAGVRARTWLRTALRGVAASPLPSLLTALTVAVTLVLGGAFALVVANMQGLLDRVGEEVGVTAYLAAELTPEEVASLEARSAALPGVASVEHVSREEAARRFAAGGGDRAGWLEALGASPLPASLEIALSADQRTGEGARAVAEALRAQPGVEDVTADDEWVDGYARTLALLRGVGWALGGVLAGASLLLVASTIRLAIYARRDEIEILSLVGASRTFVALPFLLEGALVGAVGGVLALAALAAGFRALASSLAEGFAFLLGAAPPVFLTAGEAVLVVAIGAALGLCGAAASLLGGTRT
jgi:cell division transport system permease protein